MDAPTVLTTDLVTTFIVGEINGEKLDAFDPSKKEANRLIGTLYLKIVNVDRARFRTETSVSLSETTKIQGAKPSDSPTKTGIVADGSVETVAATTHASATAEITVEILAIRAQFVDIGE